MNTKIEHTEYISSESVQQKVATKLYAFSWVLEILVIISGLLLAILLANQDVGEEQTTLFSKYTLGIIIALAAVFEFAKIPLAEAFVSMTGKRVKLICLLVLCSITAVTYETMFQGISLMIDQRKTSINAQEKLIAKQIDNVTTRRKESNLVRLKVPASNASLISLINDEIIENEKEKDELTEEINDTYKTNNLLKKQTIAKTLVDLEKEIMGVDATELLIKGQYRQEVEALNVQLGREQENSFFRKARISKTHQTRLSDAQQRFTSDKKKLDQKRLNLGQTQSMLRADLIDLASLNVYSSNQIEKIKKQILTIEEKTQSLKTRSQDSQENSVYALAESEEQKSQSARDILKLERVVKDSEGTLIELKKKNPIFIGAGFLFGKRVQEISVQEYSVLSLIIAHSMALLFSIVPFLLAGLATYIKIYGSEKKSGHRSTQSLIRAFKQYMRDRDNLKLQKTTENLKRVQSLYSSAKKRNIEEERKIKELYKIKTKKNEEKESQLESAMQEKEQEILELKNRRNESTNKFSQLEKDNVLLQYKLDQKPKEIEKIEYVTEIEYVKQPEILYIPIPTDPKKIMSLSIPEQQGYKYHPHKSAGKEIMNFDEYKQERDKKNEKAADEFFEDLRSMQASKNKLQT